MYGKLRQGFPSGFDFTQAYNLVQSSIQKGRLQNVDVEAEKSKTAFLVCHAEIFICSQGAYTDTNGIGPIKYTVRSENLYLVDL